MGPLTHTKLFFWDLESFNDSKLHWEGVRQESQRSEATHTRRHAGITSHSIPACTYSHKREPINSVHARTCTDGQSYGLMYIGGYKAIIYIDAGFIHMRMDMRTHTQTCRHDGEGTLGKVGSNLIWPWQHRGRKGASEGGLVGGRDG